MMAKMNQYSPSLLPVVNEVGVGVTGVFDSSLLVVPNLI
jgi:hypothetical protein